VVEGQEIGRSPCQVRRHPDLFRIHGEMDQTALLERENLLPRVAVVAVLVDGIGQATERILQFQRDTGTPFTRNTTSSDCADLGLKWSCRVSPKRLAR